MIRALNPSSYVAEIGTRHNLFGVSNLSKLTRVIVWRNQIYEGSESTLIKIVLNENRMKQCVDVQKEQVLQ